jgi:hypothetical protein
MTATPAHDAVYADDYPRHCAEHDTLIPAGDGLWDDEDGERRGVACCGVPLRMPDGTLRAEADVDEGDRG